MPYLKYAIELEDILDEPNVAEIVADEDLKCIGSDVVEDFNEDEDSRTEWAARCERALDLALQVVEEKSTPWPGAANVKYPLISTASMQFAARAYPALIPGPNVVKGRTIGFDMKGEKASKAVRIGKHMSYQLFEEMEDWEEEMDRLCITLPILGTVFKKTYHDELKGKNKSMVVLPQDLVVDYWATSLEEAQRKTHVLEMSDNDIYERVAAGMYLDVELEEDQPDDDDSPEKERQGLHNAGDDSPYTILEQHTYLDLDGDGYAEPYIVTVHKESEKVLRIVKRFTVDDIVYTGEEVLRIEAFEYFTKFEFMPSPDGGFYGIGFGTMLGPINDTINTLTNQLLDAGTLSNMQGGFISKGVRLRGGATKFSPGEWKNVNTTGDDLRKGLFPLPVREPSMVLFNLLNTMVTAGEKLSSVTDMMTGEIPGQNTKATVAVQAIEQGMKVFNAIYKRTHRALKKEFRKLYKLNALYLPKETYFQVLDMDMAAPISRSDYEVGDVDVIPYSDPNVGTESQRMAKLEALQPLLAMGTIDPMEFTVRYLEATEQSNPQALLAKPKGPSPEQQAQQAELQLKGQEEQRKQFEAQTKAQVERAKVEIADKLANSSVSKEEIDSIVALINIGIEQETAKAEVDSKQKEAKEANDNKGSTS
jgi:chaperonin GroES